MDSKAKKTCKYYLESKKRFCKFEVSQGTDYCSNHFSEIDTSKGEEPKDTFVPCPIDPSHTVSKSKLAKHMYICPKLKEQKKLESALWYKLDYNLPSSFKNNESQDSKGFEPENNNTTTSYKKYLIDLKNKSPDDYTSLLELIPKALEKALNIYKEICLKDKNLSEEQVNLMTSKEYIIDHENYNLNTDTTISDTVKNQIQCQELVSCLQQNQLLEKNKVYIEYGAGKGALSHHISLGNNGNSRHILIELETRRHKADKHHREGNKFVRVRGNIKDFNINTTYQLVKNNEQEIKKPTDKSTNEEKVSSIQDQQQNIEENKEEQNEKASIIGVCKHMCGSASDLTIYSMLNADESHNTTDGFMIATCCHHRCEKSLYVNNQYLSDIIGVPEKLFKPFFLMSSWGIYHENAQKQNQMAQDQNESKQKALLGLMAKRVIDIGRIIYLHSKGYQCKLIKFCDQRYSPENFIIIGKRI